MLVLVSIEEEEVNACTTLRSTTRSKLLHGRAVFHHNNQSMIPIKRKILSCLLPRVDDEYWFRPTGALYAVDDVASIGTPCGTTQTGALRVHCLNNVPSQVRTLVLPETPGSV